MSNRGMFLPYEAINELLHDASCEETGEYTAANTLWDMMRARNIMPTLRTVEKYHKGLKERKILENDPRLKLVTEALASLSAGGGSEDMNTESNLKLCAVVKKGDLERVKELIDAGANVGYTDNRGQTLLNLAIQNGLTDMALILINNGVDLNLALKIEEIRRDSLIDGGSNLCRAVNNGDLKSVTKLIDEGISVNYTTADGYTPLRYAIEKGNNDIIEMLIDSGANVKYAHKFAEEKGNKFVIAKLKETESNRAYGSIGVPFFYNMKTGHGMLTNIGFPVSIDESEQTIRHLHLSRKVNHRAFRFIMGKEDLSIHDRIDISLSSYLEQHNNPAPFATYPIPCSTHQHKYLVNFYKNIFREMIDFITYLLSIKISIDHFANNLTIKSIGVNTRQRDDHIIFLVLLCDATPKSKKEDFIKLERLIKAVVTKVQPNTRYPADYPADLHAFLTTLKNSSPGNTLWLKNHIVFLSTTQRNVFMHQLHSVKKHRMELVFSVNYQQIIRNTIISTANASNWTVRFRSGDPNCPVVRCFNHGRYIGSKESMLRFIRNMAEHLCENFTPPQVPSMEETHFIIMHYFGRELIYFQREAASYQILDDLL